MLIGSWTQGWLAQRILGGVPREQKMLKGHLPRVIYQHVAPENIADQARLCEILEKLSPPAIQNWCEEGSYLRLIDFCIKAHRLVYQG